MAWTTVVHPEAQAELEELTDREQTAIQNAVTKLRDLGPQLAPPHIKTLQGLDGLNELRPRQGRSPWRALYRLIGDVYVIGAICPDAMKDRRLFDRGVVAAEKRFNDLEED